MARVRRIELLLVLFFTVACCICLAEDTSNDCTTAEESCENPDVEDEHGEDSDDIDSDDYNDDNDYEDDDDDAVYHTEEDSSTTCSLYLAKSTIPNSGLGVFTGISHEAGSIAAPGEIAHQLIFNNRTQIIWNYFWQSFVTGGTKEGEGVQSLIPGLGMAANSFLPLVNVRSLMGKIDSAGINRGDDEIGPGSGAFSTYHDTLYLTARSLVAGEEIFADYGDIYFRGREHVFGMIPLAPEFEAADGMVSELWAALEKSSNVKRVFDTKDDEGMQQEIQGLWDVIRTAFVNDERVRNALPPSILDLPYASNHGTANLFLRGENPRSLEWLETNGYCMDTLDVRNSNILQAGRGAFAKQSFTSGETILPLPMLQLKRDLLHVIKDQDVISHQLLLNYCFGHRESSLLLYPYSSTSNFVNHAGHEANAKIMWARDDPTGFHLEGLLSSSVEDVMKQHHSGLLMLLVATRDIAEGEEVTIDYGSDWQEAWDQHVSNWSSDDMQRSAAELNESDELSTIFEDDVQATPSCHYRYFPPEQNTSHPKYQGEYKHDGPIAALKRKLPWIEAHATTWTDPDGNIMSGHHLRPCMIFARHHINTPSIEETIYTVQMFNPKEIIMDVDQIPSNVEHFVKGVPRSAIVFQDDASTSHAQNIKAFRHEIGFGDDSIWPESWKDLKQ